MGWGNESWFKWSRSHDQLAAMPIYGKNLKKSSLDPNSRWPWKLICSIKYSSTTKFVQMMTLGWPWPILQQGQIWPLCFCMGKSVRRSFNGRNLQQMIRVWGIFSDTIVVYDIKVGRYIQLNEYNVHEPLWISKVNFIHWPSFRVTQIQHFQTSFAQKPLGRLKPNFIWSLHGMKGVKFCSNVPGHMTTPRWKT